jgi:O-acetyl-ADP-ribose deacetylase
MKHAKLNLELEVIHGSLTEGKELVLVNASNTSLALGTGVSGAIRRSCGPGYQELITWELRKSIGASMEPGEILLTNAGKHPTARYVAHVAVMDDREGFTENAFPNKDLIVSCCTHLWEKLEQLSLPSLSVAMVALGSGTGRLGARLSVAAACDTLFIHHLKNPFSRIQKVVFYGHDLPEFLVMIEVLCERVPGLLETLPREASDFLARLKQN